MKELKLLATAVNMIGFLGLSTHAVFDLNPTKFNTRVSGLSDKLKGDEFSPAKLAEIAAQSLAGPTLFRQTSIKDVNDGKSVSFEWSGGSFPWMGGEISSGDILIQMARHTLVAAMYDILATRKVIAPEHGPVAETVSYEPRPAMIKFVESHHGTFARSF